MGEGVEVGGGWVGLEDGEWKGGVKGWRITRSLELIKIKILCFLNISAK